MQKGVSARELDEAKRYLTGSFPLNLDSQSALADYMASMQRYHLGMDYLDKRNDKINAVTLAEVNALAKEIFSHKPLVVMVGQ
jgi:zinc protease